jgi:hypothetical protein
MSTENLLKSFHIKFLLIQLLSIFIYLCGIYYMLDAPSRKIKMKSIHKN